MKNLWGVSWGWLGKTIRRQFLLGILATVPIAVTVLILSWVFTTIDNILKPLISAIWGHPIPGIGFAITIVLIYLVGVVASNVLGRRLIHYSESLVAKVPLVRPLYAGIKQILESFSTPGKTGFKQTVLMEFPRKGIWTIGFITNETPTSSGETQLSIFIPNSPNPTSGFLQILGEDEVVRTNIPVNEALKMVISAGTVSPTRLSSNLPPRSK